jgi:hypothetical protein
MEVRYNSTNPSVCVDSVFDWQQSGAPHFDARLLRSCEGGGLLRQFWITELPMPNGWSFTGSNKRGACFLLDRTSDGRRGSNALVNAARTTGCGAGVGNITSIQAGFEQAPSLNATCARAAIYNNGAYTWPTSPDRFSCIV